MRHPPRSPQELMDPLGCHGKCPHQRFARLNWALFRSSTSIWSHGGAPSPPFRRIQSCFFFVNVYPPLPDVCSPSIEASRYFTEAAPFFPASMYSPHSIIFSPLVSGQGLLSPSSFHDAIQYKRPPVPFSLYIERRRPPIFAFRLMKALFALPPLFVLPPCGLSIVYRNTSPSLVVFGGPEVPFSPTKGFVPLSLSEIGRFEDFFLLDSHPPTNFCLTNE